MSRFSFYLIQFLLDYIIIGLIPVLIGFGVPIITAIWFTPFCVIALHTRQWFVEKYKNYDTYFTRIDKTL